MIVDRNSQNGTHNIKYGDSDLEIVCSYKYLGTTISNDCYFNVAHDALLKSATKAYYMLSNTLYSNNISNVQTYLKLFDALVRPILLYNCEIWGVDLLEKKTSSHFLSGQKHMLPCEKLEIKMLKYLLGVPKGTSNVGVRSELFRLPLRFYVTSQIYKFYSRLKLGSKNQLLNEFFKELYTTVGNPFSKFLTMIADCGVEINFPSSRHTIKRSAHHINSALQDKALDTWDDEIIKNRKLDIFHKVKESYDPDPYIYCINDRHTRKFLSFIRLSCHPLNIEYGRYNNTARNERYCKMCPLLQVEDEFHSLMKCPKYNSTREKLLLYLNDEFLLNNCDTEEKQFQFMLQAPNKKVALAVSKYIKDCLSIRKSAMYQVQVQVS